MCVSKSQLLLHENVGRAGYSAADRLISGSSQDQAGDEADVLGMLRAATETIRGAAPEIIHKVQSALSPDAPLISCAACGIRELDQVDDQDAYSRFPVARVKDLEVLAYHAGNEADEAKRLLLLQAARTADPETGKPHVLNFSFWIMDGPAVAVVQVEADHAAAASAAEPDAGADMAGLAPACVAILQRLHIAAKFICAVL